MNMGGIELGSSDKHTQNHTYPRIARNPELRGIRGGSLCQLNPAYQKTLFSSYEMGGGMHCAVQALCVFTTEGKQLLRLDKPTKAAEWDKLCKDHGTFDLQKWTAKKVDALFTDIATSHGLRPDWHRPTEFRADTSVLITAIEKTMNNFTN